MTAEAILRDLVAIDSVSSRSNAEIISYLTERCESAGFVTKSFSHIDESGAEKINLLALAGDAFTESPHVELALIGHTDTVPYDRQWTEALRLTEKDGQLFGRGACDTKAFIAAALTAVESLDLAKMKRPLALIFTADEDIGCLGAKRLASAKPLQARYAIVGEPTSLQPVRAGKGYCLAQITVRGHEAHSAYPQLGVSAIFGAARLVERIEKIAAELKNDQRPDFDPPYTTLNVGLIDGGTAKNVVAGECGFTLEWRSIPGQQSEHVLKLVQQAAADLQSQNPNFTCEIDAARADESFETSADSQVVRFLEEHSGKTSGTVALGAEAVVFGPGDIRVAHRTGEFVPVDQLDRCVTILRQAIERFCM